MIAFLVPNMSDEQPLFNQVKSVDFIGHKTGTDFFPSAEDSIENKLEKPIIGIFGLVDKTG
jgi:hypothetical protein